MATESHDPGRELIFRHLSGATGRPRLVLSFASVEGRVECVRVEIGARFAHGEDPTKLGSRFETNPPPRPLYASTLRRIRLHAEIKRARKIWLADLEEIATGTYMGNRIRASVRREARDRLEIARETARYDRPGPSQLGKDHFEKVAAVYRAAHDRGEPPTLAVSERFGVARSTAGRWVSIARNEYRLLPKTHRGKAKARPTRRR